MIVNCECSICGTPHFDKNGLGPPTNGERTGRRGKRCQCDVCGNVHGDGGVRYAARNPVRPCPRCGQNVAHLDGLPVTHRCVPP